MRLVQPSTHPQTCIAVQGLPCAVVMPRSFSALAAALCDRSASSCEHRAQRLRPLERLGPGGRAVVAIAAELHAAGLGCRERILGPPAR